MIDGRVIMTVFIVTCHFEYENGIVSSVIEEVFDTELKAKTYCECVNKMSLAQWTTEPKVIDVYSTFKAYEVT